MNEKLLTTTQAAKALGVTSQTVRRYIRESNCFTVQRRGKKDIVITQGELIKFAETNKMVISLN